MVLEIGNYDNLIFSADWISFFY